MNIIYETTDLTKFNNTYTLLELDTIVIENKPVTTYCVLSANEIPIIEMSQLENWKNNHNKIMENYRKKNWPFCKEMLSQVYGRWNGTLDSFYDTIKARIDELETQDLPDNWTGHLEQN